MSATATASDFRPHLGTSFTAGGQHPLTLTEVTELPSSSHRETPPFSLVFECTTAELPAATYPISHPVLPPLELFLSPFEGGAGHCKLEAVFN